MTLKRKNTIKDNSTTRLPQVGQEHMQLEEM